MHHIFLMRTSAKHKLKVTLIIKFKVISICEQIAFAPTRGEKVNLSITYHDIIAFNQKLSVEGSRYFKCLCNFAGCSLNLRAMEKENRHVQTYDGEKDCIEHKLKTLF